MKEDNRKLTEAEKINELIDIINDICSQVREKYVQDDVCGLCEYDADHGLDGYANECPGFERDDCFCLKESFLEQYEPATCDSEDEKNDPD